jgi:two-component system nitrogen regulation response regulator NtrX
MAEPEPEEPPGEDSLGEFKEVNEKVFIAAKLREYDWNITETAKALKMSRSALYKRMERLELTRDRQ